MSGKGVTYKKQARKMIFHVYNFMKADAQGSKTLTVKELEQKVADATKASVSTVRRIIKDARDANNSADNFVTPGKKRARPKKVLNFSLLEQGQIKRIVHNFHVTENEMLTMEKLTRKLAGTMDYKGSENALRRTTKGLGFRWKKVEGGRRLLIEKSDIRLQRIEYLQNLRNDRQEGRNIIYTHHTFIEAVQPENKKSAVKTYMCVFSASTDSSFIPDSLYVFGTSKAGYDDHFYDKYKNWITEHLIPNIPENSVVVIGSEKCHDKEYDVIPMSCGKRCEMMTWLEQKGIEFDRSWLKPQLFTLIKNHKSFIKEFLIDKLLAECDHKVLRIPLCHPDLNPLQIASEDVKRFVRSKEMQFTQVNVTDAVIEKFDALSTEFKTLCRQVKDIEQEYRKSDYVIDMLTEEFKFYAGQSSDQDDDDDDEEPDDTDDEEEVEVKKERLE